MTSKKVVLRRSVGIIFPKVSQQEIDPALIGEISLKEEGTVLREYALQIDGLVIKGKKSDVQNLYRVIQFVRGRRNTGQ